MILYLHGFASSGNATKSDILKNYILNNSQTINDTNFVSPDLPASPAEAIKLIDEVIQNNSDDTKIIFGSSLGGFYALYFSVKYNLPAVLINPAVKPQIGMAQFTGMNKNYKTGEDFEFKESYLDELKSIYDFIISNNINYKNLILVLAEDDSLLDYKKTLNFLNNQYKGLILEKEAGHEFSKFEVNLPEVFKYLSDSK